MNFRVALQYEFTALSLDDCLERLGHHESDELAVQVKNSNFRWILNECHASFYSFSFIVVCIFGRGIFIIFLFQISAYVDNEFDVAALMEEAETKQAALDQVSGESQDKRQFPNFCNN